MKYKIILKNPAKKFIKKLDQHIKKRILDRLAKLEENPKTGIPLGGDMRGLWKLREREYRIIYQIIQNELIIYVLNANHRKKSYKH